MLVGRYRRRTARCVYFVAGVLILAMVAAIHLRLAEKFRKSIKRYILCQQKRNSGAAPDRLSRQRKTTLVNHILTNERGVKFAVIVNDIGEVNIDADLIQKGGVVGAKDDSLVALQNGCICCTLKMDLVEQVYDLVKSGKFDYIVIEASGVCEPAPIAQTICSIPRLGEAYRKYGIARLDCIVTVVDALRLQDEFGGGDNLTRKDIGEEDIEI